MGVFPHLYKSRDVALLNAFVLITIECRSVWVDLPNVSHSCPLKLRNEVAAAFPEQDGFSMHFSYPDVSFSAVSGHRTVVSSQRRDVDVQNLFRVSPHGRERNITNVLTNGRNSILGPIQYFNEKVIQI